MLQIYLKTKLNVCIKINPHIRLPRTYKRFNGLFAQLLTKLKIRGENTSDFLLKVIKNPLESHFPDNCYKIGTSTQAKLVDIFDYVRKLPDDKNIIIAVGAVSHGHPGIPFT
jgi:rRNA small subunit pseudouridine methyltransferase Nep1